MIINLPQDLLDRHHHWHTGGRRFSLGTRGSGLEFLVFHRDFLSRCLDYFAANPQGPASLFRPWTRIPDEYRRRPLFQAFAGTEDRIVNQPNTFATADELGRFMEPGIHGYLHDEGGRIFGEPALQDVTISPTSSFFYQIHGLVDEWWNNWQHQRQASLGQAAQHVIVFEHANFRGRHKHVVSAEPNLNASDDATFNDRISSVVVLRGNWRFYRHTGFREQFPATLGPGLYPYVGNVGIRNDAVSSLQPVSGGVTHVGAPLDAHAVLFDQPGFHGAHRHVFTAEDDLNAAADNGFNDRVSSIVVLRGNWRTFRHADFVSPYPPILGPGTYSFVTTYGIRNNDLSSLRPTVDPPTTNGTPLDGEVLLFEHGNFHGSHRHIYRPETNLNANNDSFFNDRTSSIAVERGGWRFYRNANWIDRIPVTLSGDQRAYPWVEEVGIVNDTVSSVDRQ